MTAKEPRAHGRPAARPEDVATPEAIVAATYAILSGPASEPRDWARLRSLFAPGARLMPMATVDNGGRELEIFDVDGYIASRTPLLAGMNFYETEVAHRLERDGAVAHLWSRFESRRAPGGPVFMRGVNSVQLVYLEGRWWVVSILWGG